MKMTAFWDITPCSLEKLTDVSELLTASIIRAMRLHGTISEKAVTFSYLVDVVTYQLPDR
jgi:hypothetical protein